LFLKFFLKKKPVFNSLMTFVAVLLMFYNKN
jgi:hypothetical protein